jgi:DNA-binding response OmpR family regulator
MSTSAIVCAATLRRSKVRSWLRTVNRTLSLVVADDDPDILGLLERRLSRRGYEVVVAADGRAALEAVRRTGPDAVVLDRLMPAMSGEEVCAALKADARTAAIPVVLLSAHASEREIVEGFGAGADDYLTKPFDLEELDERLRRLVASAEARG